MQENNQTQEEKDSLLYNNYKESLNQLIWKMVGTILVGLFAGLLVFRSSEKDSEPNIGYFFVIFGIFTIIGVTTGMVRIMSLRKRYEDVIKNHKNNN